MLKCMRAVHVLLGLLKLLWITRGRLGGPWWAWRRETAFGRGQPGPAAADRRRSMWHFLAWIWRMP
ncbi:MAG: hypothetical protein QF561_04990 [Phycisphaerales bacterium]|nr:hypothetical protein [Phycisphaerales bacterium]